jgi:hypothetical protein
MMNFQHLLAVCACSNYIENATDNLSNLLGSASLVQKCLFAAIDVLKLPIYKNPTGQHSSPFDHILQWTHKT